MILFIHIPKTGGISITNHNVTLEHRGHTKAKDIEDINDYYSFAIVRNPYDRLLSTYHFYYNNKVTKRRIADDIRKLTFAEFVDNMNDFSYDIQLVPQHEFISKDVDYIGRFEQLDESWKYVCHITGARYKKLPVMNKTEHDDWEYVYNDNMKDRVYNYFKKDFELFGYEDS